MRAEAWTKKKNAAVAAQAFTYSHQKIFDSSCLLKNQPASRVAGQDSRQIGKAFLACEIAKVISWLPAIRLLEKEKLFPTII